MNHILQQVIRYYRMMEFNSVIQTRWLMTFSEQRLNKRWPQCCVGNQRDEMKHTHYFSGFGNGKGWKSSRMEWKRQGDYVGILFYSLCFPAIFKFSIMNLGSFYDNVNYFYGEACLHQQFRFSIIFVSYCGIKNSLDTLNVTFLDAQGILAPDCFFK